MKNRFSCIGFLVLLSISMLYGKQRYSLNSKKLFTKAQRAFSNKFYKKSINLYKKYIKIKNNDYYAINQIGVAYYHINRSVLSIRYLKLSQNKIKNKSFNYYYQSLCYKNLNKKTLSMQYLTLATRHPPDKYSALAMYSLGKEYYKRKKWKQAKKWFKKYLRKFPKAYYAQKIKKILHKLSKGKHIAFDLNDAKSRKRRMLFYENHELSLLSIPNYWFLHLGGNYNLLSSLVPETVGGLSENQILQHAMIMNVGFGLGPFRSINNTLVIGYGYRQAWEVDQERFITFMHTPGIKTWPYAFDLMVRQHQIILDYHYHIIKNLFIGIFLRKEYLYLGTKLFAGQQAKDTSTDQVISIGDTILAIPWIGWEYLRYQKSLLYLYLHRYINKQEKVRSNQSYGFGVQETDALSLGFAHITNIPSFGMSLTADLFYYNFIFNDFWLDYQRKGGLLGLSFPIVSGFYVQLKLGLYEDDYLKDALRFYKCDRLPVDQFREIKKTRNIKRCPRKNLGFMIRGRIVLNFNQYQRIKVAYEYISSKSTTKQEEFNESGMMIKIIYTIAFPSVSEISRFTNRYNEVSNFSKK